MRASQYLRPAGNPHLSAPERPASAPLQHEQVLPHSPSCKQRADEHEAQPAPIGHRGKLGMSGECLLHSVRGRPWGRRRGSCMLRHAAPKRGAEAATGGFWKHTQNCGHPQPGLDRLNKPPRAPPGLYAPPGAAQAVCTHRKSRTARRVAFCNRPIGLPSTCGKGGSSSQAHRAGTPPPQQSWLLQQRCAAVLVSSTRMSSVSLMHTEPKECREWQGIDTS